MNLEKENELNQKGLKYIYGVDEVGRGPIAGPLVICFYCFDIKNDIIKEVNDSKKVLEKKRLKSFDFIKKTSLDFSFGAASSYEIDKFGIVKANELAILRGFKKLKYKPEYLLFDYNVCNLDFLEVSYEKIIKGDSLIYSIACSSMLAKVFRDSLMMKLSKIYNGYFFEDNKGYGTKKHIQGIQKQGLSNIHRKTFCRNFVNI